MPRVLTYWRSFPARRRKVVLWAVGLALFYTIFGFLILPLIVKRVAIKQLSKQLDREVTIRSVRINPYVLSGTIRGLLVKDKDGEAFLSLEEAYANFQLSSFFGKPWVFKEIHTTQPFIRVQINKDYTFNFSDLAKKFSQPSPAPPKPSKPLFLHINLFEIWGASASFTDLTPSTPFHRLIGPLQITLTHFHTDPNNENPYAFNGTTDSGEKFFWRGQFSLEPLQSSGELTLEGLSIARYAPLFQDLFRFEIKDGVVDARSAYTVSLAGTNYSAAVSNAALSLKSFKVAEKGATEHLLELDELSVTNVSADTVARTAEIGQIAVNGGRLEVKRDREQTINLIQMSQPPADVTNAPGGILVLMQAATNAFAALVNSTNLWSARVRQIDATNCALRWEDLATTRPVRLLVDDISLAARELSNISGSNETAVLSLRWNTNGTVRVETKVQIAPPSADVTLAVKDLELRPLDPYLEPFVNLFITESKVGLAGTLQMRMATNGLPEVTFHGDARLDDFVTVDTEMSQDLVKWKSFQFSGIDANLQPPVVTVKDVTFVEPYAHVTIDTNQTINLLAALKIGATNAVAAPKQSETAASPKKGGLGQKLGGLLTQILSESTNASGASVLPKITINTLTVSNASVQFTDRSVQPPVKTSIEEVSGTVTGISSDEMNRADVRLTAKSGRSGPIEITGKLNPLSTNAPTDLRVSLTDVDLVPTSPYAGKFLGYRLNRGKLGLQVQYEVSQRKLNAKNVVVLDQFTLGERVDSPDAVKLPIRLAIALLKDRNGKIELDVPIEGNLDDPQFHFGKVIAHVLVNIITKMITSPFAALGAVFGGKGEEVSYQDFAPGSTELQQANLEKLDTLLHGLQERPGLQLEIEGSYDPVADLESLRRQKLAAKFRTQKWSILSKSEQARLKPEQVALSPDEYAVLVKSEYAAIQARAEKTGQPPTPKPVPSTERAPARQKPAPKASPSDKGATALVIAPVPESLTPTTQIEREVLETVNVSDNELNQLAAARAREVQQKILESGKIESSRVSLAKPETGSSTNQASRVYFHLQ
jgi:Domain of Unknown Function (DUF748).